MLLAINYGCLSLEKPENHAGSKTLSFYLVDIEELDGWDIVRRMGTIIRPKPPTDADFLETDNISADELVDDSYDGEDVPMECPGKTELLHALELFQKFSLFADEVKLLREDFG